MEDKIPPVMPPQDYMLAMLQESLLDNSVEKKREFIEARVKPYLRQFDTQLISETALIQALLGVVYEVLFEKGDNFRKDSVGLSGVTEQNITGNCVLFNFALKLLLENYSFISNYWGLVVLKDTFSRYVHHFATLVELSSGEFYILDPVYKAHMKQLVLNTVEIGKVTWLDTELRTHQAIMAYPFKRLVLSQQNFWTGVSLYNKENYDAADKAFSFAMSILGEQQGMLQAIFSRNLMDEMGRYGKINPEYTFNVGLVRYKQGRTKEALIHFRFAQSMLPDNPDYSYYTACTSEELGQFNEAICFYKRFVELTETAFYGSVNVAEKIKSLEIMIQSDQRRETNLNSEELRSIDELFSDFAKIVIAHAPVPPISNRITSDVNLIDDLYFSLSDLVGLHLGLADIYQIETSTFDDAYNVGEMFEKIVSALLRHLKPSTTQEFIKLVQERTQRTQ